MTLDEIRSWPPTCSVPDAAAALGYSKSFGYQLVIENAFPCRVIKLGRRVRVVTASLVELLEAR